MPMVPLVRRDRSVRFLYFLGVAGLGLMPISSSMLLSGASAIATPWASMPAARNACCMTAAGELRTDTSICGILMKTPCGAGPVINDAFGPLINIPEAVRTSAISEAYCAPSLSDAKCDTDTLSPLNVAGIPVRIVLACCWDNVLHSSCDSSAAVLRMASATRLSALCASLNAREDTEAASFEFSTAASAVMPAMSVLVLSDFSRRSNLSASLPSVLSSPSSIDCKCDEKANTPPSPNSSPATPTMTRISNTAVGHNNSRVGSFLYSPKIPNTKTTPDIRSSHSETSSPIVLAAFDQEKRYPISPYTLLGGIGMALPGIALLIIAIDKSVKLYRERKARGSNPHTLGRA